MSDVLAVWASLRAGLPLFFLHLSLTTIVWLFGVAVSHAIAAWRMSGDTSPAARNALSLVHAGDALAIALPLAACLAGSVTVADLLLWGTLVVTVQVVWSVLTSLVMRGTVRGVAEGDMMAAGHIVAARIGFAMLNAAAISG